MNENGSSPPARGARFTAAAWLSLALPVVATGLFLTFATNHPQGRSARWPFPTLLAVALSAFVSGCYSLAGVKKNGPWVILPPAVLGILASLALALLALLFWVLSDLPGP